MARIVSIDYGHKRCGIAATDPLQIIVNGLTTVETKNLLPYLEKYCKDEKVEKIIIGWPLHADGNETKLNPAIRKLLDTLKQKMPNTVFEMVNEEFSSVRAKEIISKSGASKKQRADKSLVDKMSAVVILQEYLGHI